MRHDGALGPVTSAAEPKPAGADSLAGALALKWADRDAQARLIVDDALHLIWTNPAARRHLKKGRDLEARARQLATANHAHQAGLADFIAGCDSSICTWCLPCEDGDGYLLFRATEIGATNGSRYFGLSFYRSGAGFTTHYADLDKVFQLTPAENRVLLRMVEGHTADEIARDLGVSVETTRSHIRQIYAKLNVTSREGLFYRVSPYRL